MDCRSFLSTRQAIHRACQHSKGGRAGQWAFVNRADVLQKREDEKTEFFSKKISWPEKKDGLE